METEILQNYLVEFYNFKPQNIGVFSNIEHLTIEDEGEVISELLIVKVYEDDEFIVHPVYSLNHYINYDTLDTDKSKLYLIDLYYKEDSYLFLINIENGIEQFEKNTVEIEDFLQMRREHKLLNLLRLT